MRLFFLHFFGKEIFDSFLKFATTPMKKIDIYCQNCRTIWTNTREEEQVFIEAKDNKRTIWTVLTIPTPNISHNVNNRIVK